MPTFSESSIAKLLTCHYDLQRVFNLVIVEFDCSVLCGFRGKNEQEKAFKQKKTKLAWPKSKHNRMPSLAIDVIPYPVNWHDTESFYRLKEVVFRIAYDCNVELIWGGDWDGDGSSDDERFLDFPHFEIK